MIDAIRMAIQALPGVSLGQAKIPVLYFRGRKILVK